MKLTRSLLTHAVGTWTSVTTSFDPQAVVACGYLEQTEKGGFAVCQAYSGKPYLICLYTISSASYEVVEDQAILRLHLSSEVGQD